MTSWGLPDQKESLARFMPLDGAGGGASLLGVLILAQGEQILDKFK